MAMSNFMEVVYYRKIKTHYSFGRTIMCISLKYARYLSLDNLKIAYLTKTSQPWQNHVLVISVASE